MHQITTFSRLFVLVLAATFAGIASFTGLLGLHGCGASQAKDVATTPLTADEARVYEHGVDFIATLGGLEGRWRDDWDKDLDIRIGSADAIAIVTVKTVRTDTDPEQRVTHRLFATVDRKILGELPGKEIELAVREGAPGFMSVNDNLARLQSQPFVAYLKWYEEDGGRTAAHWHLSPASSEIVAETEHDAALRRGGQGDGKTPGRVVVHNN